MTGRNACPPDTKGRPAGRDSAYPFNRVFSSPRHSSFATRHCRSVSRSRMVTVPSRERLAVDCDAERRAHLVLPAIAAAHGPLLVVKDGHVRLERLVDFPGDLGHAVLLDQREDGRLDRGQPRMQPQEHPLGRLAVLVGGFVLLIGLAQKGQRGPIGARRRLNHVGDEPLLAQLVEVAQVLAAAAMARLAVGVEFHDELVALADQLAFHVAAEIEIAAMGHALQLAKLAGRQEREGVFDVGRAARVMAQFFLVVIAEPQPVARQAKVEIPPVAAVAPVLVPLRATSRDGRRTRSPSARTRESGR